MLVYGVVRSSGTTYDRCAGRGIERVAGPGATVLMREDAQSIAVAYNEILDEAARRHPDAEAVVLLHQDLEILDVDFPRKVLDAFSDGSVGLLGLIGARQVRSIAYWRADVYGHVREASRTLDHGGGPHDVEAVDGILMVLAPAVAREIRFDEVVAQRFHGYDIDFSFQVRAHGLRVVVADIEATHHTSGGYGDRSAYLAASRAWRRKWLKGAPLKVVIDSWTDELSVALRRDRYGPRALLRRQRFIRGKS